MGKGEKNSSIVQKLLSMMIVLLVMFFCSGVLLIVLTALTYYMDLSANIARIGILAIYVISGFVGGIFIGKIKKERKFLWGIVVGVLYFAVLLLLSLFLGGGKIEDMVGLATILVLAVASSMIGGMVS